MYKLGLFARFAILLCVGLPIFGVLQSLFLPWQETWLHLLDTVLPEYVYTTGMLVLGVLAGTLIVGVSTAWFITMFRLPLKGWIEVILVLPMAIPGYILAYVYTDFLEVYGPVQSFIREVVGLRAQDYFFPQIRSLGGACFVLTLSLYPYVYLLARASFIEQSYGVYEVSRTLGCNLRRSFVRAMLPLARSSIVAGLSLVTMETLNDFGVVQFFGVDTLTTAIYRSWYGMGEPQTAQQIASILLMVVVFFFVVERVARRGHVMHGHASQWRHHESVQIPTKRPVLLGLMLCIPGILGFFIPVLLLILMVIDDYPNWVNHLRWLDAMQNTFYVAGISALAIMIFSSYLVFSNKFRPSSWSKKMLMVGHFGYALPGAVLGVGMFMMMGQLGLAAIHGIWILVLCYLARFMTLGIHSVESGMDKINPRIYDVGKTLGKSGWKLVHQVYLPMLGPSLLTALVLVVVDLTKELSIVMVVRPFNFDTLAILTYRLASDERLSQAAFPALLVVVVGLIPVLLFSRLGKTIRSYGDDDLDMSGSR